MSKVLIAPGARGGHIIAWRGQLVNSVPGHTARLIGNIADRSALGGYIRINDWND